MVVATKCDLRLMNTNITRKMNLIPASKGQAIANAINCPFIEVSSKLNYKVNEVSLNHKPLAQLLLPALDFLSAYSTL